jgi:hypothetical protein
VPTCFLFHGFLLRLRRPGRNDAVFTSISDGLAKVLVCIGHQDIHHIAGFACGPSFGSSFAKSALLMPLMAFCMNSQDLFSSATI